MHNPSQSRSRGGNGNITFKTNFDFTHKIRQQIQQMAIMIVGDIGDSFMAILIGHGNIDRCLA